MAAAKGTTTRAAAKRPAAGKKPAAKAARAAKTAAGKKRADAAAQRAKQAGATGKRPSAGKKALRDSMILARAEQGVPWAEIAKEAGIDKRSCQRVVEQLREVPSLLDERPMKLLEDLVRSLTRSIADYEGLAFEWADTNHTAALGAKKAADETRFRLAVLLENVGKLPDNVELYRTEEEMRQIAEQMAEQLTLARDGRVTVEDAIEYFRSLVVDQRRGQLEASG